jgi:hypothetical protein
VKLEEVEEQWPTFALNRRALSDWPLVAREPIGRALNCAPLFSIQRWPIAGRTTNRNLLALLVFDHRSAAARLRKFW